MARSPRLFRRVLRALLFLACMGVSVQAGTQREEPLVDSVRTALSAAVHELGPPTLVHAHVKAANAFQQWLIQTEARLEKQLQRRKASPVPQGLAMAEPTHKGAGPSAMPDVLAHELASPPLRREFLQTVWYESQRAGLDPSLAVSYTHLTLPTTSRV